MRDIRPDDAPTVQSTVTTTEVPWTPWAPTPYKWSTSPTRAQLQALYRDLAAKLGGTAAAQKACPGKVDGLTMAQHRALIECLDTRVQRNAMAKQYPPPAPPVNASYFDTAGRAVAVVSPYTLEDFWGMVLTRGYEGATIAYSTAWTAAVAKATGRSGIGVQGASVIRDNDTTRVVPQGECAAPNVWDCRGGPCVCVSPENAMNRPRDAEGNLVPYPDQSMLTAGFFGDNTMLVLLLGGAAVLAYKAYEKKRKTR
jgi:hypothetical protein